MIPGGHRYDRRDQRTAKSRAVDKTGDGHVPEMSGGPDVRTREEEARKRPPADYHNRDDDDGDNDGNGDDDDDDGHVVRAAAELSCSRGRIVSDRWWYRRRRHRDYYRQYCGWLSCAGSVPGGARLGAAFGSERRSGEGAKPLRQVLGKGQQRHGKLDIMSLKLQETVKWKWASGKGEEEEEGKVGRRSDGFHHFPLKDLSSRKDVVTLREKERKRKKETVHPVVSYR